MDWWLAVLLGIVQGATEFLPISSSAHLALMPYVIDAASPSFAFDVLVQMGTLVAVVGVLRKDLLQIFTSSLRGLWLRKPFIDDYAREGWLIVLATIPAVIFGVAFKKTIEEMNQDPRGVLVELLLTGMLLIGAEVFSRRRRSEFVLTPWTALWIGVAQALAILPGVSRSGATIAMALFLGMPRAAAGRFSFLLSVPVMLGAGILSLDDLFSDPALLAREGVGIVIGFVAAAIVGFVVVSWFLDYLRRKTLWGFATYCIVVAVGGLLWLSIIR